MGNGVTAARSALDAESLGSNPNSPVMKLCKRCETQKPLTDFNKRNDRADQVQHLCRECNSEYGKEWYEKNKKKRIAAAMKRKQELKQWVAKQKEGQPCEECGWAGSAAAMHWHHVNPEEKLFSISDGSNRYGKKKIIEEIKKCRLLCANCHAEATWGSG